MEGTILEKLYFALGVSGTAMIIVFGVLIVLMFVIKFQSFILGGGSKKKEVTKLISKEVTPREKEDAGLVEMVDINKEYELVSAIMAALIDYTGKSVEELNIKSIKRINNNLSWRNASTNR